MRGPRQIEASFVASLSSQAASCQVVQGLSQRMHGTIRLWPTVAEFGYQSLVFSVSIILLLLTVVLILIIWLVLFGCLKCSVKKAGEVYVCCRIGPSWNIPLQT